MPVVAIIILVSWVAFWIYWLTAAVGVKPGQSSRSGSFVGLRVGVLLLILLLVRSRVFGGRSYTHNPWLQGTGLAIFVLGLGLAICARLYLGRNWGRPMSQKDEPELVTSGPYHTIRHPIYTGILLGWIGTTVAVSLYWLIAVVLLGAYFIYSAFTEERLMTNLFPEAYPEYKRSTKMLVPFIF